MKTAILIALCATTALAPGAAAVRDLDDGPAYRILRPYVECSGDIVEMEWTPDPADPASLVPRVHQVSLDRCLP